MTSERIGDWCQTFTGRQFWPMDPRAEDVCVEDIAHALALQCRFAGHCREPYSVAEHSVRVSTYVGDHGGTMRDALAGLLHDASEAYLVDVPRPVKPYLTGYKAAERVVQTVVNRWAGLQDCADQSTLVHEADEVLLATEARDLMGYRCMERWGLSHAPMAEIIVPWDWRTAEREYLARYFALRGTP